MISFRLVLTQQCDICSVRALTGTGEGRASSSTDGLPYREQRLEAGVDRKNILPDGTVRDRVEPDRFADTEYSTFSDYELRRLGVRHDGVTDQDIDEARTEEPSLAAELEALFARARETASASTGSDPASEVVGKMERAAAIALHSALLECMRAAGVDEESSGIWSEDVQRANFSVPACFPDPCVPTEQIQWGQLVFAPPALKWTPAAEGASGSASSSTCTMSEMEWPLASFSGTHDDSDEAAACQLRLLQGEDDGLLFGFMNAVDLVSFERTLRVAASSARAAVDASAPMAMDPPPCVPSESTAGAGSESVAVSSKPKRQKRSEEPRVQRGRELRGALQKVAKLYSHDKTRQAKEAFRAIPEGKTMGARAILGRADELRELLFTFGGLNTTRAVLEKFLSLSEVKRLLDEDFFKSRQELADAQTATAMLVAAKEFLTVMHQRVAGGRRSDAERNAFWASVVSLMPADLVQNRQGRAMMRILGISYATVKTASVIRRELEDSGKAWVLLTTKKHFDNIEAHW